MNDDMDVTAAMAFVDMLVGCNIVAANPETGDEFGPFNSPGLRAFIVAKLGDETPGHAYDAVTRNPSKGLALAHLLREVAATIERAANRSRKP